MYGEMSGQVQAASARLGQATRAAAGSIAAGAQNIAAGARYMAAASASGRLSVDPQSGQDMTKAIDTMLGDVRNMQRQLQTLAQDAKLGRSPDAQRMSEHNKGVATGGQSAHDSLVGLQQALVELRDAIDKSMKNYVHTDTGNATNLKKL
jgi:hypothetical protein